ncbi:MAG: hypothetical protein JJE27_01300, partial [Thermoleophilia bacterium]|nr:hypothetical protein [Thermoleophilia bacterium]
LAKRFLIFGGTDGKCRRNPQRLPVADRARSSVNGVKALGGRCSGLRGRRCRGAKRAVTVGYLAFRDALDQLVIGDMSDGPGLYGGSWELTDDTADSIVFSDNAPVVLAMDGIEQVPGVIVDGRVTITDYPRVSGSFKVLTPTGRDYAITISGLVAYDQRGDRVRLSARSRRVRVSLSRGGRKHTARAGIDALRARSAFARAAGTRRGVR